MSGLPPAGDANRDLLPGMGLDWAGRQLVAWTRLTARHRWVLAAVLVAQAILFSAFSAWIVWQPDVLQFFSADSPEVRDVRAVAGRPGVANQLRLDVHARPGPGNQKTVEEAARELGDLLRNSGEFRGVWTGANESAIAGAYAKLIADGPLLLDDAGQATVEGRMSGDFLQRRFAQVREQLADPDGEILMHRLAADPLDIGAAVNGQLQALSPVTQGGSASLQDGLLIAQDDSGGCHALIVGDPASMASDQKAAERTLAATDAAIDRVARDHPGAGVWVVGAHRGYVENARRVKADVTWVSLLGTLAVGLVIAFYFRRVSTALLCMLPPAAGVGLALGMAGILHVELPLLLLGFAGLLCGSTTDYGIQIIAECRRIFERHGRLWHADIPALAARAMLGPISMSVATSVTGFAALGLSQSPGLRALGLFVAAATVCIWGVTFLVLPAYLGPWVLSKQVAVVNAAGTPRKSANRRRWLMRAGGLAFLGLTVGLGRAALRVRFAADPQALDGSPQSLRADEAAFASVWGDPRNHAVVLVRGPTAEAALEKLNRVNDYLADQKRDGLIAGIASPAAILPDEKTAAQRTAAWRNFWTPARREELRRNLAAAAQANGFKSAAFAAYADRVTKVSAPSAEERLVASPAELFPGLIEQSPGKLTIASVVAMRTGVSPRQATSWAGELRARYPETVVVGGAILFWDATERARAEAERLGPWCLLAILLPLVIYFRRLTRAWLVMVCLIVGGIWVLGAAQLLGGGLNLLSLVPMLFTLGVAVDYGIYAAAGARVEGEKVREGSRGRPKMAATGICALTTLVGTGALTFAGHPAMRWLGITLVAGVAGGYLAALFAVWPVMRWSCKAKAANAQRPRTKVRRGFAAAGWALMNAGLALAALALIGAAVGEMSLAWEAPAQLRAKAASHSEEPNLVQTGRRSFAAGNSSMCWRPTPEGSGFWEIRLAGDAWERGRAAGELCAPLDYRIESEMLDELDQFLPEEWARWVVLRGVGLNCLSLPGYVKPEYQEEIFASALGPSGAGDLRGYLAPGYARILSYHALHDVSQMLIDNPLIQQQEPGGCTGVVSLPSFSGGGAGGHLWLARNFDFEGGESFGRQKSVTFVDPPKGQGIAFVHVAWPGLAGCVTGMNAEKIAVFLNAAATKDFRRIGTPTILMARDILEHAHSIAEAEGIIRATQVFVSDIIVVADGKTGAARVFEKSPAAMDFFDVHDSAVVANHLVTPRFKDDPVNRERMADGTTLQRYGRARELLDGMKGSVGAENLVALLRDKKTVGGGDIGVGNRNAIDGMIACHGVVMDVTAGRMWVAAWPYVEGAFLEVDLDETAPRSGAGNSRDIAAAAMMRDGEWQRWQESRDALTGAEAAMRSNDWVKAGALAKKAVTLNGQYYLGHELLGRALLGAGDTAGARAELSRALALDPPYAQRRAEINSRIRQCGE